MKKITIDLPDSFVADDIRGELRACVRGAYAVLGLCDFRIAAHRETLRASRHCDPVEINTRIAELLKVQALIVETFGPCPE